MKYRSCPTLLLSALLSTVLAAPAAWAAVYELPADGSPVVGTDSTVASTYADTLTDIAHRYSLGYYEIIRANPGVDVWLPGAGKQIVLPGRRILPASARKGRPPCLDPANCLPPLPGAVS